MSTPERDAELVTAYIAGDRGALGEIYRQYGDSIHDTAAAMLGDRHEAADVTQDVFVIAAERLGQLRDPTRLKPWLFAILRNEVYRRTKQRRRSVATDFSDPVAAAVLPAHEERVEDDVAGEELAELVRGAARGLDPRDQLVLELSARQGLNGADLADALGVSTQQGYGMVHRMRERAERSLGAYCVARAGRRDCPELAELLSSWDGEFSVLIRKRVARHVDDCEICERTRRKLAPLALFGGAPVLAAPPDLWDRIAARLDGSPPAPPYAFDAAGGFPGAVRAGRRPRWWWLVGAAAVVLLVVVGGLTVARAVGGSGGRDVSVAAPSSTTSTTGSVAPIAAPPPASTAPTTVAATSTTGATTSTSTSTTSTASTTTSTTAVPATTAAPTTAAVTLAPPPPPPPPTTPPGRLGVSTATVDLGTTSTAATVTLANTGGSTLTWSLAGATAPFGVSPTSGTLAPGASTPITVTIDRTPLAEGSTPTVGLTFQSPAIAPVGVTLKAGVQRAPVIKLVGVPPTPQCVPNLSGLVRATVVDESPLTVTLRWSGPSSQVGQVPMTLSAGVWTQSIPVTVDEGQWAWRITATDAFNNTASATGSFAVVPPPC